MQESTINFKLKGKPRKFTVVNNLDEHGLNIEAALINWAERTKDYSINSFCKYVVSKDPVNIFCEPLEHNKKHS